MRHLDLLSFFFFCTTPVSRSIVIYCQEKVRAQLCIPYVPRNPLPTCDTVYR